MIHLHPLSYPTMLSSMITVFRCITAQQLTRVESKHQSVAERLCMRTAAFTLKYAT